MRLQNAGIVVVVVVGLLALTLVAKADHVQQAEQDKFNYLAVILKQDPPTATPTPSATPTNTPTNTATATTTLIPTNTPAPTNTPQLPPPSYNNCQADPNPGAAPNYPVRITAINKVAETVTLQNVSVLDSVDLSTWKMCSILGNQMHPIFGTLAPGESRTFSGPAANIWNNSERDDGALYNGTGQLVSYWVD